jgi:hypothetical protein
MQPEPAPVAVAKPEPIAGPESLPEAFTAVEQFVPAEVGETAPTGVETKPAGRRCVGACTESVSKLSCRWPAASTGMSRTSTADGQASTNAGLTTAIRALLDGLLLKCSPAIPEVSVRRPRPPVPGGRVLFHLLRVDH